MDDRDGRGERELEKSVKAARNDDDDDDDDIFFDPLLWKWRLVEISLMEAITYPPFNALRALSVERRESL